jgi:hypothetical protein
VKTIIRQPEWRTGKGFDDQLYPPKKDASRAENPGPYLKNAIDEADVGEVDIMPMIISAVLGR